jgi:hypothetical protein
VALVKQFTNVHRRNYQTGMVKVRLSAARQMNYNPNFRNLTVQPRHTFRRIHLKVIGAEKRLMDSNTMTTKTAQSRNFIRD